MLLESDCEALGFGVLSLGASFNFLLDVFSYLFFPFLFLAFLYDSNLFCIELVPPRYTLLSSLKKIFYADQNKKLKNEGLGVVEMKSWEELRENMSALLKAWEGGLGGTSVEESAKKLGIPEAKWDD